MRMIYRPLKKEEEKIMYYGYNQPCVPVMPIAAGGYGGGCGSGFGGCLCAVVLIFFIIIIICGCGCGIGCCGPGPRFDCGC